MSEVIQKTTAAKKAASSLSQTPTFLKNHFLENCAALLRAHQSRILEANQQDVDAQIGHLSDALIDRLRLTPARIEAMAQACLDLMELEDPIAQTLQTIHRPNGLTIRKVGVPLGVIAMIYESRPNVTIDAATLCLKAGNAVVLRGGKEALHSNHILVSVLKQSLIETGLDPDLVQLIENPDRALALELMQDREHVDVLIPRGSAALIQTVIQNAKIPVLETGVGNCHLYVESSANLEMAADILINAKCSRPGVCNAVEKCLIDEAIAEPFLKLVVPRLLERKVELRACAKTCAILPDLKTASEDDWDIEYLDLILGIKIVANIDEAIAHIQSHGTHHSEAIVTQNTDLAKQFQLAIDAAAVYVNASTRFTDGFEFGFGAEIGISTQKLHARGPMGLKELTTYKYLIDGSGQIR